MQIYIPAIPWWTLPLAFGSIGILLFILSGRKGKAEKDEKPILDYPIYIPKLPNLSEMAMGMTGVAMCLIALALFCGHFL